jgi:hypothetical protein
MLCGVLPAITHTAALVQRYAKGSPALLLTLLAHITSASASGIEVTVTGPALLPMHCLVT